MSKERIIKLNECKEKIGDAIPDVMESFGKMYESVFQEGKLTAREKQLVALGIVIAKQCPDCIVSNLNKAIEMGITFEEIMEVCGVSILMGGGPGVAYSCKIVETYEKLKK
ncbi:carboxymuconolactone decarboxylase family protein [Candidatus Contubernalis alkaliaceticus]|uniref:carboxymuconolactone decarboxylase family protein n=1 Tax=Candidatus Contubernalis alkaliaceticus TaxID=338645 RepID=UPI001F4BF277|nr:carboxymuconolactone decarboxylase family protein [Candidatus Contubernalis alkalaceticus]UNC91981.1 carboxymuconolactone decarboxylase family protein [Candidatus Contubernalis alkalaceticus]